MSERLGCRPAAIWARIVSSALLGALSLDSETVRAQIPRDGG
jgi:hypothetical protein